MFVMHVIYISICFCWVTTMAVPTYKVIFHHDDKLINQTENWLRKYGYLDASTYGNVPRKEDFRQAILDMRRFHGIPVTDEIDHEMIRIMNMPRCGFPDTVEGIVRFHRNGSANHYERYKRYSLFDTKWTTNITYGFVNFSPDLSSDDQRETFSRAINDWTAVANINIREVANGTQSDIAVLFANGSHDDGNDFDGIGGTFAHAFWPDQSPLGGDVHFDDDETFSTIDIPGVYVVNLYHISLHELGHSLGIDHSSVPDAVMFPVYRGFDDQIRLARDDIAAIQSLYGARDSYKLPPDIEDGQVVTPEIGDGQSACSITFDAIVRTSFHIYFFKDYRTWQTDLNFEPKNYVSKIESLWQRGPTFVDAAFTKKDNSTVLLSGDSRWEYFANSFTLKPGFPKRNDDIGIPSSIDAAVYIAYFDELVLFKGGSNWTLHRETLHVQERKLNATQLKVPTPINAAFSTKDKVYFLTGDTDYFLFDAFPFQPVIGNPRNFNEEIANKLCEWCNTLDPVERNEDDNGSNANGSKIHVHVALSGLFIALLAY
ncbi:Matrix metalloproteinase-16 [Holothuria leucospilota]|uniref:Matrix metalloproteinase-16 n=1 Tax=Holothuria leucospilota TaxID=206669 RepID=A0A9Q1CCQ1_HOLLE|nr:Matrix metalloproteinase-16 [Holothuria leucospilota]